MQNQKRLINGCALIIIIIKYLRNKKFMVFHPNQKQVQYPNIKINNIEINRVTQLNFLGIILSADLK